MREEKWWKKTITKNIIMKFQYESKIMKLDIRKKNRDFEEAKMDVAIYFISLLLNELQK